jgi:hypothetical protein
MLRLLYIFSFKKSTATILAVGNQRLPVTWLSEQGMSKEKKPRPSRSLMEICCPLNFFSNGDYVGDFTRGNVLIRGN